MQLHHARQSTQTNNTLTHTHTHTHTTHTHSTPRVLASTQYPHHQHGYLDPASCAVVGRQLQTAVKGKRLDALLWLKCGKSTVSVTRAAFAAALGIELVNCVATRTYSSWLCCHCAYSSHTRVRYSCTRALTYPVLWRRLIHQWKVWEQGLSRW